MLLSQYPLAHGRDSATQSAERRQPCLAPRDFYVLTHALVPRLAVVALLACALGLYLGLFVAPSDSQQGEVFRIAFLHVPAAWMSVLIYLALALCAGLGLLYKADLAYMAALALAPTGALFAFLALWSGALLARPIWGSWWIWDLRLVSEMILLVLYAALIALQALMEDRFKARKFAAVLALAGAANIPFNAMSAQWWNSLYQGAPIGVIGQPGNDMAMQIGTLATAAGFFFYAGAVVLLRLRCVILEQERNSDWVKNGGTRVRDHG